MASKTPHYFKNSEEPGHALQVVCEFDVDEDALEILLIGKWNSLS